MDVAFQLYWHWIVVALALTIAQRYLGTSFVVWVGGAAFLFALLPIPIPDLSDPSQLLLWSVLAGLVVLGWYTLGRPVDYEVADASQTRNSLIGESGEIIRVQDAESQGLIRFPYPLKGEAEWPIVPLDELEVGDQVTVIDVIGGSLVVKKD